jgi:hypothetical protein
MQQRAFLRRSWRLALAACLLRAVSASAGAPPAEAGLFDQLFGADAAAEKAGRASDGLALPRLEADGIELSEAMPVHDLGAGGGMCVALEPLLDALELAHAPEPDGGRSIRFPTPARTVLVPGSALLPSPSGACLPFPALARHLPLTLTLEPESQRLRLRTETPLPALMRRERAERQARLRPEAARPSYALVPRAPARAAFWSADLSAGLALGPTGREGALAIQMAGELLGLAARANLALSDRGAPTAGLTLSEARETPDLLGPLNARSVALGDISSPAQPLIADSLAGRGMVISSRPPWRVDLVDEIELSGPLAPGWEAELWQDERLVAATRTADAAGNWRFAGLQVRLGSNRWVVRLYGPHGESSEEVFSRMVGTEMNAENELDYSFGVVDGGRPLVGPAGSSRPTGPAAFGMLGYGVAPDLTARLDVRASRESGPALSAGLHGAHLGGLWAATLARDGAGGLGGAVQLARRLGAQDIVVNWARHGRDAGIAAPPDVRTYSDLAAANGQGRLAFGRQTIPWQLRLQTADRRNGGREQLVAGRLSLPRGAWQANAAFGLTRLHQEQGGHGWDGNAAFGLGGDLGGWRLRSNVDVVRRGQWRMGGAAASASRGWKDGTIGLDLDWQADTGRIGGGVTLNRRFGPYGLSAGMGRGGDGWRVGVGLNVGFWQAGGRWRTAPAGLARSGAVLADMFLDADGDGERGRHERGVEGGRFIVGSAVRAEQTDSNGHSLLRGLPAGRAFDMETQLASLPDLALRPARAGDRLALRPGEIRRVAVPLRPTGSVEARILLVSGDARTPLSNVPVRLRREGDPTIVQGVSDFDGYVLFEGIPFGRWTVETEGRASGELDIGESSPDARTDILLPAAG